MEEAMAQSQVSFAPGQIVKGTVIEIRQKEVMIDIGYKSEGMVPVEEFREEDELQIPDAGAKVSVLLEEIEDEFQTLFEPRTSFKGICTHP